MDFLKTKFEQQISASIEEDFDNVKISPIFGDPNFKAEFPPARIIKEMEPWTYDLAFNEWKSRYIREQLDRANNILRKYDNANRFLRLKNVIGSTATVIPFVGAGMACESGFRSWNAYLWHLQEYSDIPPEALQKMLDAGQYEEAAECLLNSLGEHLFEERFQTTYTSFDPSLIKGAINYLPLLFNKAVVTTNFDNILEQVYQISELPFDEIIKGNLGISFNRHISEGRRCLLKFHGHYSEPTARILTKSEYDRAYAEISEMANILKTAYKSNTFLFIGCSLEQDRTMEMLKSFVDEDKNNIPSHFAFLPEPDDEKRRVKERMLAERKIFPIWYPDEEHDISIDAFFIKLLDDLGLIKRQ